MTAKKVVPRSKPEMAVIVISVACGVVVLAILMEYLSSGKGLLSQGSRQKATQQDDSEQ